MAENTNPKTPLPYTVRHVDGVMHLTLHQPLEGAPLADQLRVQTPYEAPITSAGGTA